MVSTKDRQILRSLAGRVREIAELPEQRARRQRWHRHNALQPERPLVLCFPEGAWSELLPEAVLQCENSRLREWERALRSKVYWWEHICDDNTLEPWFNIGWSVRTGNFGVDVHHTQAEHRGSYIWEPPVKDLERDLDNLEYREPSVDRATTNRDMDMASDIFGDLLPPRIRGSFWWTMGITWEAAKLVGLENLMLYMYDEPEALHRLMAWLRDEHLHFIEWFEQEDLLSLMNEDDYTGSGGLGYTRELPQPDWVPGEPVRLQDIWGFAESQETVGVSPHMFGEFIFPYQLPLLDKFGLNCYGCCEPVNARIDYILQIPRLRRVSVSPWADQEIMAENLGQDYIFSRKPNPAQICVSFDEDKIRDDLAYTLQVAGEGALEIIMKDTHTVQHEPWRITRWVEIALEEVDKYMAGKAVKAA
jgi:hypothetical protein